MKKFFLPLMLLLSMFTASIISCSGDSDDDWDISEDSLEVICDNVVEATQVAGEVFAKCNSVKDAEKYIDEIKQCESVEDVNFDNHTMFVKVKGFGSIPYIFEEEAKGIPEEWFIDQKQNARTRADNKFIHNHLENKKACIVNQLLVDEKSLAAESRQIALLAEEMFSSCGYLGESGVKLTVDFFENKIYDYDIIFIITHGSYDAFDNLHWIITVEECDKPTDEDKNEPGVTKAWVHDLYKKYKPKYKSYLSQMVKIGSVKEKRNGITNNYYYLMVSEKLIELPGKEFDESKTPIIFNTACQSMKGNDNLADAFINKGAKAYYGYDESNGVGHLAGYEFFARLMVGTSLHTAYNTIPEEYRIVTGFFRTVQLKSKYDTSLNYEYSCIEHPHLDNVIGFSEKTGDVITLKANFRQFSTKICPDYGFKISETDNPKDAFLSYSVEIGKDKGCYWQSYTAYFEKKIPTKGLKPETTYYCWAFIDDGPSICYSNMGSFTTPEKSINQVIPDEIRKTMEPYITIYDGNNPPNIEGIYVIDPMEIVYDMTGDYEPGDKQFAIIYFEISNQNPSTNTLDYREQEVSYGVVGSESKGEGAFISGEGNNFSVYFNTTGVTHLDAYDVTTTHALVISGTKTYDGIRDLRYSFVIVDKGADPDEMIMNIGDFRVFKDGDNWAEKTYWSFTRSPQITVRDGQIITPWKVTKRKQIH